MTGADLLLKALKDRGVEFVATLCGNGLNPFYAACQEVGMHLIDTRNEQAASYIADAYGRLTRKVGVCAVSSGIAHINALAGVANAYFDGAPMLLITGASVHRTTDMGKFQEMDQIGLAAPLCKYVKFVDRPELMPFYVQEAFAAATSGRPGPVHLTIPIDILEMEVNPERVASARVGRVRGGSSGDPGLIREAADLMAKSERPLLVVGSGAFYAGAEDALEKFVAILRSFFCCGTRSIASTRTISRTSRSFLKVLTAMISAIGFIFRG